MKTELKKFLFVDPRRYSRLKIEKNFGNIFFKTFKIHKYNYRKWTLVEVTKNLGGFYNLKHEVFEGQIN